MSPISSLRSSATRMLRDKAGNFGMMTAILIPVAAGAAGLGIDISSIVLSQRQLQVSADGAAIATASALVDGKINESTAAAYAKDFVIGQMANVLESTSGLRDAINVVVTKTTSGSATHYDVTVTTNYALKLSGLSQLAGFKTSNIQASSQTIGGYSETQGSVSMFLALDKSGSMGEDTGTINASQPQETYTYDCGTRRKPKTCQGTRDNYYTKLDALKIAVGNMTAQLNTADPTHIYARTGAVSYDIEQYTASNLNWGTADVTSYVNALVSGGGTNSSDAMATAYNALIAKNNAGNDKEDAAHKARTGQIPKKYIVFMTDGDNNDDKRGGRSYDTNTKATCTTAKNAGIEIYTIAFMAPTNGQTLLHSCATDDSHYFQAESMADLLAAFKKIGAKAANVNTRLIN